MKKIHRIVWLITMLVSMVAGSLEVSAASKDVTMQVGETQTLYLPSSVTGKRLKSVTFYSNGISYVQVVSYTNSSVKVKAIKAYSSPIIVRCDYYYYVTSGSYTYQAKGYYDYNITVVGETKVQPTKITLPTVISLEVGESRDLVPTVTPSNAEYTLTWKIMNSSIATVYQNGMITGKAVGETDLKVSADNGVYTMCRIVVYKPSPTSVSIKSSMSLMIGQSETLSPTVYPSNASYTLSWISDNPSVAMVSDAGRVTAVGSGKARITVKTSNGLSDWCDVMVSAPLAYATITEAKYATFCDAYNRDFSKTGITVYTVSYRGGGAVTLNEVEDGVVPANTAVLLYKDVSSEIKVSVPESSVNKEVLTDNQLGISDGVSAMGPEIYVLANQAKGVGFYHWASDKSLSTGKVYLRIMGTYSARDYIDMEDINTNSLGEMQVCRKEADLVYDIHGRRVLNPQKGICIINGKKVLYKYNMFRR